jgi:penicillin amidase
LSLAKTVRNLVVLLALVGGAAGAVAYAYLRRSLPPRRGTLRLAGLNASVEVIRDHWGVPHVFAESIRDALFAQGYVQAQDRLWQMELGRRLVSGRLTEIFGPETLEADRLMRRVGLHRAAQAEVSRASSDGLSYLEAYAAGVNAFLETVGRRLPPEFLILRFRPAPWTAADSLAIGKYVAWMLSGNWDTEIVRSWVVERLGPEVAAQVEPLYPAGLPMILPPGTESAGLGLSILDELRKVEELAGVHGGASNNWVIDGSRSTTGKPLLANDPHLPLQMPSIWYELHLNGGALNAAGVALPGVPGVVIGHNERIAWGITAAMADGDDLFLERINPDNPRQYEYKGVWVDGDLIREEIQVRGQAQPVVEEVLVTRHGPIIGPAIPGETRALAMRTTAAEPRDQAQAIMGLNLADNWEGFREAMRQWPAPPLNFIYADVEGNIGYQMAGLVPQRAKGYGLVPSPGWTGEYDWTGFIPFDEMPFAANPERHYVVTANNQVVDNEYPHFLSAEYIDGYRAQRIAQLLEAKEKHSTDDFRAIQSDVYSIPARELAGHMLALHPADEDAQRALNFVRVWDGRLAADSVAATIVEAFYLNLLRRTLSEKLGPLTDHFLGKEVHPAIPDASYFVRCTSWLLRLVQEQPARWFPGRAWREVMEQSLTDAIAELRSQLGDDMSRWTWGRIHYAPFEHVMGRVRALRPVFNRGPMPVGGDMNTIANACYLGTRPWAVYSYAASYRQIIDLSDLNRSLAILPGGQSGHPASRHYADMIGPWARGDYHPLPFDRAEVERHAEGRLTLAPAHLEGSVL